MLGKLGDELRFVLITSAARVVLLEGAAEGVETALPALRVRVQTAGGEKCVRCWHYREDVGSDAAHPEICGRCVSNVAGPGEDRRVA